VTRLADLSAEQLAARVKAGIALSAPPFIVRLSSPIGALHRSLRLLYGEYEMLDRETVPDFVIRVAGTGGLRRLFRRQSMAYIDTLPPYVPLPEHMAPLMFEQALNWCVATRTFTHLILHAAVVARDGRAAIIPGQSGQGKSTLCAALVSRGWRHVSDEFALLNPDTLEVTAHPRPISLKNESIGVVASWAPQAVLSEPFHGTPKGTIGYMRPGRAALEEAAAPVVPAAVIFPRYDPETAAGLSVMGTAAAFIGLTACSVNYREFGETGFRALSRLVEGGRVYSAVYPETASAVALVERAVDGG
jgi:hypothetical protein